MAWSLTLYFTFLSQEAFEALIPAEWMGDEGIEWETDTRAVHVSGIVFRNDTPEGEPPVAKEGYRVECRFKGEPPETWATYAREPMNPDVVFADGQE